MGAWRTDPPSALRNEAMIATQPPANDTRMEVDEKKWPSETVVTSEPPSAVSTQSQSPRCMYHKDCRSTGGAGGGGRAVVQVRR